MPSSVIHDQTPDQLSIGIRLVLHLHDLDHVQINRLRRLFTALNSEDGIDDISSETLCQLGVQLGSEGSEGDGNEGGSVKSRSVLVAVKELIISDA
jgi:hypothetical protein